jgi:hypothetical protein
VITRQDFYGRGLHWLFWGPLIFGPPLLAMYGLSRFQPLNPNDPAILRSVLIGYAFVFVVLLVSRRRAFPWATRAPGFAAFSLVVVPVVGVFLGSCVFLFGNALLDRSKPRDSIRLIDERRRPNEYSLMCERQVLTGERLQVPRGTPPLARGTRIVLTVREGFFGSPWIAKYRIQG